MRLRSLLVAVLVLAAGCNPDVIGESPVDAAPAGRDAAMPPDAEEGPAGLDAAAAGPDAQALPPDAGSPAAPDASQLPPSLSVTCSGPTTPVPVNTRVDVTCQVDNGGRPLATPILSTSTAGAVFARGASDTQLSFSFNTSAPGYVHPLDFADTDVTVGYEVHDAADPGRWGKATLSIGVLGNYWVGDSNSSGSLASGVLVYLSNGVGLGQAVGPTQIKGVFDIRNLPDGTMAVSSLGAKTVRVFDRKGVAQPQAFPDTDPFTSAKIWESGGYEQAGPRQMAVAGDELWVTGAYSGGWGLAVFNWKTGAYLRFVPSPLDSNQAFPFTSIVRRTDGVLLASSVDRRTICAFDEKTHAALPGTPCVSLGEAFCDGWSSFVALPGGEVVAIQSGVQTGKGCPLAVLGPTLNLARSKLLPEGAEVYGMVQSGDELVALGWSMQTSTQAWFVRADATTFDSSFADWWNVKAPTGLSVFGPRGLARLVAK